MFIKYLSGLIFSVIVIVFIYVTAGFGSNFAYLIDLPSAIISIVFPLIFMGIFHGPKNIARSFSVLSGKNSDKAALLNAKTFFDNWGKMVFSTAFIAFIMSFIAMMFNLENKEALGPNTAFISTVWLYAGIINIAVVKPYQIILSKKLAA